MITLTDAMAVKRATRLVVQDDLTASIREGIIEWAYQRAGVSIETAGTETVTEFAQNDPNCPKLAALISCSFCASVWLAMGAVTARRYAPRAWEPIATLLALSCFAAEFGE